MPPGETDLGDAELEVLKALWELGQAPVREVMNHLHGAGRRVAYTTVLTVLTRLEQKGFVASDKSGVAYVYRPKVSRARVTRSRLRSLIEQLYDGSAGPLVLQLVQQEKLSVEEIEALQRLVDGLDRKKKRKA
jgi:predicted transcriptional regulator